MICTTPSITIITPVYKDWDAFAQLITELDRVFAGLETAIQVVAVDDGTPSVTVDDLYALSTPLHIERITVLKLLKNVGHQRAITTGLVHIYKQGITGSIIVMDSDGEDRPDSLPALLKAHTEHPNAVIVAQRAQRSEGTVFTAFYYLYKGLFKVAVNEHIDFGNFCVLPSKHLKALVYNPDMWNHIAATLKKSKLQLVSVPSPRGNRYTGESTMNFESLILHGLSAISVYIEKVTLRVLLFMVMMSIIATGGIGIVVLIRLLTDLAIPGWATNAVGILLVIILQMLGLSALLIIMTLNNRSSVRVIPALNVDYLIEEEHTIHERQRA